MGAVYEARDLRLEREVAVKILLGRSFGQPAALRRFRREAQAAARLNHPNIVAVYDVGSLEGEGAFLVMERVHGVTLRAELERQNLMMPAVAAEWFEPLLNGLQAAHTAGIVHRDLKPETSWVSDSNQERWP
jgi:serine/threonine protein kinase